MQHKLAEIWEAYTLRYADYYFKHLYGLPQITLITPILGKGHYLHFTDDKIKPPIQGHTVQQWN